MNDPDAELAVCLRVLARLRSAPPDDAARLRVEAAVAGFVKDGKKARRTARRRASAAADAAVLAATTMGAPERPEDVTVAEPEPGAAGVLRRDRACYVCKAPYRRVDAHYHWLCPDCAADNLRRRAARADLRGRHALLTGGRVKIGFEVALRLLRDGAALTVTSRFPRDTLRRFAAAPGAAGWWERLDVVGVDLRDPRQVLALCERLHRSGRPLDILINNAAQTVRRPPWAYAPLVAGENRPLPVLPGPARLALAAGYTPTLPAPDWVAALPCAAVDARAGTLAAVDAAGLLVDPAPANSWSAVVGDIDPAELLEVQLVNAVAPFLLLDRLRPLLVAAPHPRRYVVNVSAVEGWFAAPHKGPGHPHTNMAKAALNMLTRTAAAELAAHGVHVSSVDTGWITDENPTPKKVRIAGTGWRPPLDIADGAARVYDPIVRGEAGEPVHGVLLKDYRPVPW